METIKNSLYAFSAAFFVFLIFVLGSKSCSSGIPYNRTARQIELDQLFSHLKNSEDAYQTIILEDKILKLLQHSDEENINLQMTQGVDALTDGKFDEATRFFTQVIEKKPKHTEAWNKRATTFYMQGKMDSALYDIEQTLILESRHFGALSGLASIYMMRGNDREALKIYERIARIAPAEPHVREHIQELKGKLGMSAI